MMTRFLRDTAHPATLVIAICALSACAPEREESLGAMFADKRAELPVLPPPAGLKPSEIPAWNAISPRDQHDALEFMKNGGTFAEFMAI